MGNQYANDFEKFLAHTNEKQILLKEIAKEIKNFGVKSLLDIGAGNGLLAIPLAKKVENYLAIEKNPRFVEKLQNAGLAVLEAKFPTKVGSLWDLVLISHVISYKQEEYADFIRKAWKLVKPRGILLVITYRGQKDDWTELMEYIGQSTTDYNTGGFRNITKLLESLGNCKQYRITTIVDTKSIDDMVEALAFVASNGIPELKQRFLEKQALLKKRLKEKYKGRVGYLFPFQHFFIRTQKSPS